MKLLFLCCLVCLPAIDTFAQATGTINGKIVPPVGRVTPVLPDAPDPVRNSRLKLVSAQRGETVAETRSDSEGNFVFEDVPAGAFYVVGTCGYCARSQVSTEKIRVRAGETESVQLRLPEQGINETVTIAADAAQPVEEISKSVSTLTGQEMRDRADITLADSLRTVPGFRVQQLGGFGRTASIKSRGLRNQDTAILLDGVRFRDATAITGDATPFLSDITLTSVSRVEVLRGPGSSLYGTNAIGGTIDLQTPVPRGGWHGQVSGAAGGLGLGRFRGNISKGTADGKFGINAAISRTVYSEGIDGDDDARNTNFQSRVEFNPYKRTNISARLFLSDAFVRLNANPDTKANPPASNFGIIDASENVNFIFDLDDPDAEQRSRSFNGQIVLTQSLNDKLAFQVYYSGLTTRRRNDDGLLGPGFQSASTNIFSGAVHTVNAHFDWTPLAANRLTAGYEFEQEDLRNDGSVPGGAADFFTRSGQASSTVYFQDLVRLLDGNLQFGGGARAQFFSLKTPRFSAHNALYSDLSLDGPPAAYTVDGSASYFIPSAGTKLRLHAGNGYRVPSLYERFGSFFNTFTFPDPPRFEALGDPYLKPERSAAFDAGVDQYFWDRRVTATAVFFYSRLTDVIGFGNVVPDIGQVVRPFGGYLNQKGGVSRGVEFSGDIRPSGSTTLFASYTFTNSDQLAPQVTGSGVAATLGVPAHQITLNLTQRIDRFWVNADLLAASSYLAPVFSSSSFRTYVYRFGGNRRLDLTAGYTFPLGRGEYSLRVFGTLENVFDQTYFENGFRTPGVNGRIGASFGF